MLRIGPADPLEPRVARRWWAHAMPPLASFVLIACAFANAANADDRTQVIARAKISVAKVMSLLDDKGKGAVGTAFLFTTTVYPSVLNGRAAIENGYLLTNCHVVQNALKVEVHFMNVPQGSLVDNTLNLLNSPIAAKVLGCDVLSDLAVLEVGTSAAMQQFFHLPPPLPMAKPENIHAGDDVLTLGFALNLGGDPSVSRGIISATNRGFPSEHDCEGEKNCIPEFFSGLIQTDATINHGNSGGPLLNMKGEVVGVNTYTSANKASNVFYARSVETAAPFAKMLLAKGTVIRADLGLTSVESVPADYHIAASKHGGVRIVEFSPNSPGQRAGLRVGDIITSIQKASSNLGFQDVENIGSLLNLLAFIPRGSIANVVAFNPKLECPKGETTCLEKMFGRTVAVRTE